MKILIVDDHVLIRKGLKILLNSYNPAWEIHEAINGIQAIVTAPKIQPDIVLMDYAMPKLDGEKAARQLIKDIPGIKVIMISGFISSQNIRELLSTGIMGIISKTAGTDEVLEAIYHVQNGEKHLRVESAMNAPEAEIYPRRGRKRKQGKPNALLTPRELEVMRLIVKGYRPEMIRNELAISQRTFTTHKARIFKKCNIHSTAELLRYAYRNHLV